MCFAFSFSTSQDERSARTCRCAGVQGPVLVWGFFGQDYGVYRTMYNLACTYFSYIYIGMYYVTLRKKKGGEKATKKQIHVLNI